MAKGNLFQGMAKGKLGDVIFTRADGQQVTKAYNPQPRNAQSNAQMIQRAIVATITQAYSIGIDILDHSFEGCAVGSGCQSRFMELNTAKLRSVIATELEEGRAYILQKGHVIAPQCKTAAPFSYIVSEGRLQQKYVSPLGVMPTPQENETLAHYCQRCDFKAGDTYTLMAFIITDHVLWAVPNYEKDFGKCYAANFGYIRMRVKATAPTNTRTKLNANSTKDKVFEVTRSKYFENIGGLSACKFSQDLSWGYDGFDGLVCSGVIRASRVGGYRSSCTLNVESQGKGIISSMILDAWTPDNVKVGDSDLILEGGGGSSVPTTPTPTHDAGLYFRDSTSHQGKKILVDSAGHLFGFVNKSQVMYAIVDDGTQVDFRPAKDYPERNEWGGARGKEGVKSGQPTICDGVTYTFTFTKMGKGYDVVISPTPQAW